MTKFDFDVGVYYHYGNEIEDKRGPYLVSLLLSPDGVINGELSMHTTDGKANFTNLRILSHDTFTASAPEILSVTSSSFSVTNYPYFVDLIYVSPTTISRYFEATYAVDVFGEDNRTFTEGCTLHVSSSDHSINFISIASPSTSNYQGQIVFYSNTTGQKTLIVSCTFESQSVTNTTEFEVLSESLKIISVHPTVRFT